MIRFLKYEKCYGIGIGRFELWIAMPHYSIQPHTHPNDNSYVYHLFSDANLYRVRSGIQKDIKCKPFSSMFRRFTLDGTDAHWFKTNKFPLLFLNVGLKKRPSPSNNLKLISTK